MDFRPTEEQLALQAGVRELLERAFPAERLGRAGADTPDDIWTQLRGIGVFDLRRPESAGGAGLGVTDAVLVFEELGRALVPGPLVGTHIAAGLVDDAERVDVVCAGSRPLLVADGVDAVLVLHDDGADLLRAGAIGGRPVTRPVDPMSPLRELTDLPAGERVADGETAEGLRRTGAALTAALLVGIAQATLDRAVRYAGERHQFDRPIGAFQAVQHLLADMLVRAEVARAAVHAAAVTLDDPATGDPARAVAGAKLLADDAAVENARTCVQVHGGMGFTWEVDVHLFLKRAWVLGARFGSADEQAELVADLV